MAVKCQKVILESLETSTFETTELKDQIERMHAEDGPNYNKKGKNKFHAINIKMSPDDYKEIKVT